MITRSSAKNSSQGTPTLKSLDKASSTMIKSSGLRTEPWCTPTPTSNSSPYSEPTLTRLRALLYIACTRRTIHSSTPTFLIAHHKTFRGTRSNAFSRSTKAKNRVRFLSLRSFHAANILDCSTNYNTVLANELQQYGWVAPVVRVCSR